MRVPREAARPGSARPRPPIRVARPGRPSRTPAALGWRPQPVRAWEAGGAGRGRAGAPTKSRPVRTAPEALGWLGFSGRFLNVRG